MSGSGPSVRMADQVKAWTGIAVSTWKPGEEKKVLAGQGNGTAPGNRNGTAAVEPNGKKTEAEASGNNGKLTIVPKGNTNFWTFGPALGNATAAPQKQQDGGDGKNTGRPENETPASASGKPEAEKTVQSPVEN